jgi:phage recombination protein Bet
MANTRKETEIAPASTTALAPAVQAALEANWTPEDIQLMKDTITKGCSDAEFKMFLRLAVLYKLDPLIKEIWCVKYGDEPAQIFAGRDGFLAIAHRSGDFDGMETEVRIERVPMSVKCKKYDPAQNKRVWTTFQREYQYVATCRVYSKVMAHPVVAEVWEEEYSTGQNLWEDKPRTMIAKVAECQALRKAFRISGLYDPAEMKNDGTLDTDYRVVDGDQARAGELAQPNEASRKEREELFDKMKVHMEKLGILEGAQRDLVGALGAEQKMSTPAFRQLWLRLEAVKTRAQALDLIQKHVERAAAAAPTDDLFPEEGAAANGEAVADAVAAEAAVRGTPLDYPE